MANGHLLYTLLLITGLVLSSCKPKIEEGIAPGAVSVIIAIPAKPTVTSPLSLNALTNTNLTITGNCESGATVFLQGDDTQSAVCATSAYSFTVSKTLSSNYFLDVSQANSAGASGKVTISWILDNNFPPQVIITSPLSNPFTSGNSSLRISGTCEAETTVSLAGSHTAVVSCSGNAFLFDNIPQTTDGVYNYEIRQTDLATNSSAAVGFTSIRDTSIPPTPMITNFTNNPRYTNFSPLVVTGTCVVSNTVHIAEAGTSLANSTCDSAGTFSINISKASSGDYTLSLYQIDAVTLIESASYDFQWIYDTQAPLAPLITSPTSSPATTSSILIISGTCENNAQVNLSGAENKSAVCASTSFTFTVSQPIDGTYSYAIAQTDLAQNISSTVNQVWIRDSSALPMVTITTPSAQPYISNTNELTLNGICENGLSVVLQGVSSTDVVNPSNNLSLTCVDSAFSFTIAKPDGTHNLSLYHSNGVSVSAQTAKTWIKDTIQPNTTINTQPSSTNYSIVSSFTFSSNETNITFQCSLDNAAYSTCASPLNYSLSNGIHSINIRALDQAGNIDSTPASYTWTQESYKAIALFHFDSTAAFADSSFYSGGAKNDLIDNASANVVGKFSDGRGMATTANYVTVANTPSQAVVDSYLTVESFVKLNSLSMTYAPVISKINAGSSPASFEYGIRKQGSKYFIYFRGSTNGTTFTEVKSTGLSPAEETALTAEFNHIAVTWNLGSIKYYLNGVLKGSSSIGTVGSSRLAPSNAALRIGYNGLNTLNGSVDEARLSQIVRWSANFTPPTSAYLAD